MNRRTFLGMAGSCLASMQAPLARSSAFLADQDWTPAPVGFASPFNVADETQLFVDKVLVCDTRDVSFTLIRPQSIRRTP
jgi:hypothetical protein